MKHKSPAFQFYAAEYLADEMVQLMTLEEEGAYIRLMAYCWREGSIPNDDEKLSRLCKGAYPEVIRVVKECFNQHPTDPLRLTHKRLDEERGKQREWRRKSAEGGRKSAEKRWGSRRKPTENQEVKSVEPPLQPPLSKCLNDPSKGGVTLQSSSSSSSSSLKEKDKENEIEICFDEPSPSEKRKQLDREAEEIYKSYPRKIGKPVALRAIKTALKTHSFNLLIGCTKRFAIERAGQDPNFTPHPATWFNQERFNDDPATWAKQRHAGPGSESEKDFQKTGIKTTAYDNLKEL